MPYIDIAACRGRQQRLLAEMRRLNLDLAIVSQIEHVQWLAGPRFAWTFQPAAALRADGHLTLIAPNKIVDDAAADEVAAYPAKRLSTMRNDQRQASTEMLLKTIDAQSFRRVGVEFSSCSLHLSRGLDAELVDIEPDLFRLRRRKDADELVLLRKAIAATGAMYARAREMIEPGINELRVFSELQAVAVEELGEMLTSTGNDYACGARGGPPRNRGGAAGELYILDLGPAYRGYFADTCRTISVDGSPTDEQHQAHAEICNVFPLIEQSVAPGKSCRALFDEVNGLLAESRALGVFDHHLGHGIGLFPHEAPHLNPNWDDKFEVGDVFTAEPGLYGRGLRAGIRLENDYLVTADGIELLSDFPLEL